MAKKITSGADATLVSAAYRAGMATAPADYSGTFEKVARGYEKTMQAQSKLWKDIANIGAVVGADLMQNANEFMDYRIKGGALNPDSAKFLVDELDANKQAQKDLGLFGGILGDRETRQKKRELKIKQAELFAEIDLAAASINAGAEAVAGNLYDSNLDEEGSEMINAIIKSNLKDKVTEAGNTAVLSRDKATGELMFTLMRDGKPATGSDGKPKTMTIKEFNKTIATNVDDKGAMQGFLNKLNDNEANAGIKSLNGVYDPERKQMALNQLDSILKTPTDIRRGMLTKFGYSNTSFADDIKNPSVFSAEIYSSLLQATGADKELALGGITEGIEDKDKSGGISQDEITNNYGRLAANILGLKDPEASRAFLKEYTVKKLEDAYKYGYSKKPPVPGSTDGGFVNLKPGKSSNIGANTGNGWVPNAALNTIGKNINDRATIDLGADKFIWDNDKKAYTLDGEIINNKYSLFSTIYGENFDPANIIDMYNGIKDWTVDTRQKGTVDVDTNIDINFLNKSDNDVAANLNKLIPSKIDERNPQNLSFKPRGGGSAFGLQIVGLYNEEGLMKYPDFYPEGVVIDGEDMSGKPHPAAGKEAIFQTRPMGIERAFGKEKTVARSKKDLSEMIDILKTFGLYDNMKPYVNTEFED